MEHSYQVVLSILLILKLVNNMGAILTHFVPVEGWVIYEFASCLICFLLV